ncbi:MAG: creatininase family protein [Firmicutes bacterium]|nr:creatininase family protein [Bacillota bacterium]
MYLTDLTSDDYAKAAETADILIIPVGAVEAHGHHCPLGTGIFCPDVILKKLDELIGDRIFIAPAVPFGVCYDLYAYPGTATVPSDVLGEYLYYAAKCYVDRGMKNIVFMNGHGGNVAAMNLAGEKLVNGSGAVVMNISWWLDYSKEILTVCDGQGHAGEDETSVAMAYCAQLVQMDKACVNWKKPLFNVKYPERGRVLYENAISGDGTKASKEKGDKIVELIAEKIAKQLDQLHKGVYFED